MNIPKTILKATGASTVIFWAIILTGYFRVDMLVLIPLSMIPISICCAVTICLSIAPFYWSKNEYTSLQTIHNRYFPFYAIVLFGVCAFGVLLSNFDVYALAFIASAFFTTLKSWSWLTELEKTKQHDIY